MASLLPTTSIRDYQKFIYEVYGLPNSRHFSMADMLFNVERFIMRGLKGIRKNERKKTMLNLLIAMSWFMSLMSQLHINVEDDIWKRFPYLCSYCASCPCACKTKKVKMRKKIIVNQARRPATLQGFQEMFRTIYPPNRGLEHVGIHLAEEMGELSEAFLSYRGSHNVKEFNNIKIEAADLFSCFMGVYNAAHVSVAKELARLFSHNCHVCKKCPCVCNFEHIIKFKS